MTSHYPYWRLSAFYLVYFAALGAFVPYWTLYLNSLGFSAGQIGELMAVTVATRVISPSLWGWLADFTGRPMAIVRLGSILAVVAFSGVFLSQDYWWLMAVMLANNFFWNAVLPQFEATTMSYLSGQSHAYSLVRLWGSIGFIVAVAALGPALQRFGVELLPQVFLALMAGIWLASLSVPEHAQSVVQYEHQSIRKVLARPEVFGLLLACLLMQASHGPYYTFYSIYLEQNGYARSVTGLFWALGVLAEVAIFLVMYRLVPRFGLRRLFLASFGLAMLRWVMIGVWVDHLAVLLLAQLLHAASFGVFHAVAIQLIHRYFVGRHQGRGQAIYSSIGFGLGGAIGALYSGYAWDALGPVATFMFAALCSFLGFLVAWRVVRPQADDGLSKSG